jgi:hypothetical protein
VEALKQRGLTVAPHDAGFDFQARTREESNLAIDRIRAAGGLIESVQASNSSLEDVFIRTTQTEKVA